MNGHGEGAVGKVECPVQVTGAMLIDTVRPALVSAPEGLQKITADFGSGRYTLSVEKVDASTGSVDLRLADKQNPKAVPAVFWVEISEKPLINLFWWGAMLVVFGGVLSLRKRAGQLGEKPDPGSVLQEASGTTTPAESTGIAAHAAARAEKVESLST